MKKERFTCTIVEGHKGAACEVPFNPIERWGIDAKSLWKGRRGHLVRGTLNGTPFDSVVVPRMRRFFVMIDDDLLNAAKVAIRDDVDIAIEPGEAAVGIKPRAQNRRR